MSCELSFTPCFTAIWMASLDAARAAEFERHLLSCPQCVASLEFQESLRSSIQRAGLYERAPEALRRTLKTEFAPAASALAPIRIKTRRFDMRWLAAAAVLLVAFLAIWHFTFRSTQTADKPKWLRRSWTRTCVHFSPAILRMSSPPTSTR